ncbi:4-galactosyl-N-acetylglucosaminide 3-alpha-L-fucosyltransferase FUT6-like [Engystomops pustulosus]|uniref:4-galactosyl-N-acetylglucosaminide 3-alpha-L-fucosyltransferase FUT6-like n=1 Tax=Engystomops pustulosus TaxID=76066 RepID=UPI003AFAD3A2
MIYRREAPASANADSQDDCSLISTKEPIIILVWTFPFGQLFPLNQCPQQFDGSGCFYTADRTLYSSAHAVVLFHRDVYTSKKQLPQTPRPSNQRWVWFNNESPSHCSNLAIMNNLINLTMSYRVDSDIFAPYGWIEQHNTTMNFTIPTKTRLAAWAITNWNPNSRRVKYYGELKNYLQIDMYGYGRRNLPRNRQSEILSTYKFYFAFENSIHVDYITEKLSLDKDEEKYKQYFNWRSEYYVPPQDNPWTVSYCRVCKALKEAPPYRTIASIEKWFKD